MLNFFYFIGLSQLILKQIKLKKSNQISMKIFDFHRLTQIERKSF